MSARTSKGDDLRKGFSTGTAMVAAARAAVRRLFAGESPRVVAVRLPIGYFLPVSITASSSNGHTACASVIKDAGDDPDVTNRAEIRVVLRCCRIGSCSAGEAERAGGGIDLVGGVGVGTVTKPGLPVGIGEPAINPVPREMLLRNVVEELRMLSPLRVASKANCPPQARSGPRVFLPFPRNAFVAQGEIFLEIEVVVPRGPELARHTLNPRLGIQGGISILGTSGIVKPFSNRAYEETIASALRVAKAVGCREIVLSTGGKSEKAARAMLPMLPIEAFVQIADFFAFGVSETVALGFAGITHSVFFGKAVKMAQGHPYTHAHRVRLDLGPVARTAADLGYGNRLVEQVANANTARHALEYLLREQAVDVIESIARQAVLESRRLAQGRISVRMLLFDYDAGLLADVMVA